MSDGGGLWLPFANPLLFVGVRFTTGQVAFAANVAAFTLLEANKPAGVYQVDLNIVATVLATLAPCGVNITHTDAGGAVTDAMPLASAGVVAATFNLGTNKRACGSLIFRSTGAIIQAAIVGITTPGPLAATYEFITRRIGPA